MRKANVQTLEPEVESGTPIIPRASGKALPQWAGVPRARPAAAP
ncbi:MAG TPA: hypothetical protein VGB24_23400 [Longimicrobium sp.]